MAGKELDSALSLLSQFGEFRSKLGHRASDPINDKYDGKKMTIRRRKKRKGEMEEGPTRKNVFDI